MKGLDNYSEAVHEAAEAIGERAVHIGGERALMRTAARLFKRLLRRSVRTCAHYLRRSYYFFNVGVPAVSTLIVIHSATEDYGRSREDDVPSDIGIMFIVAACFDLADAFVHLVVLFDHATSSLVVHPEFLEALEHFGFVATLLAIFAIIIGEILVARHENLIDQGISAEFSANKVK
mmetsp:Transcript_13783/g.16650  ORF Transcript_13783/g.16650 Transcript_13783/m.16650 type:complete len:177 (+) Transcript_13783:1-531(+)